MSNLGSKFEFENTSNHQSSNRENIRLLEQSNQQENNRYCETLYFRDGKKKIDFVLVYENKGSEQQKKAHKRRIYEENLVEQFGLELEKDTSLQVCFDIHKL